ncbi:hypothetical protein [Pandoraea apista]|uniref:hypothetical protein n=1 Tax=Pandoraea apista TaxID=93218 RepID=UPI0011B020C6|nr:hypothetical protein [Pandoraea apista]
MKKVKLLLLCAGFATISTCFAAPSLNPHLNGSNFQVDASNTEDRAYQCSITYFLSSSDNPGQSYSKTFTVPANWHGTPLLHQTSYAASTIKLSVQQIGCA